MSYEGRDEFLCEKGHYWVHDAGIMAYASDDVREKALHCPICEEIARYHCAIDDTNGYSPEDPRTFKGPKEEVGFDDLPKEDHYGNKYFEKILKYKPVLEGARWRVLIKPLNT